MATLQPVTAIGSDSGSSISQIGAARLAADTVKAIDVAFSFPTLARFGVNSVRFQFLDFEAPRGLIKAGRDNPRSLDADQLDREDYFIAELEKRGIYIDFNLLVGRPFREGDGVKDANTLRQGAKGTSFFDARLIELQKEYAQQLLGHLNPYTKLKYTDDPAVAIVEINNENANLHVGYGYVAPLFPSTRRNS